MSDAPRFELPRNIERYLATLAKLYQREGETLKAEIVVNGRPRVHEGWDTDSWNNGSTGHALFLTLPEGLFLGVVENRDVVQNEINAKLNGLHNEQNEYFARVFFDMEVKDEEDWRRKSGVFRLGKHEVPPEAQRRVWGESGFRLFLSHKAEVKREVAALKLRLALFGMSAFVAHEDILPTKAWQDEIENALSSMEAFVAVLTESFHDSLWTDQEVGYALGRGVPIIALKLGKDPYGFIGRFQALSCGWDDAPREIAGLLLVDDRMKDAFIGAVATCGGFDNANLMSTLLSKIDHLTEEQERRLVEAHNGNGQVNGSYGFKGSWTNRWGAGLIPHLKRWNGKDYEKGEDDLIRAK